MTTDEVVITDERIQHIKDRHPNDHEKYCSYMRDMLMHPAYILEDPDPNTAFILKEYTFDKIRFRLILRLHTSADLPERKNSVLTFQYIKEKEYNRLIRNKKILYSQSDL